MSDDDKMRHRLHRFWNIPERTCVPVKINAENAILSFAASERALERAELLARASEGAAPEFAEAEASMRVEADIVLRNHGYKGRCSLIVNELDRRASVIAAQAVEIEELRARVPCGRCGGRGYIDEPIGADSDRFRCSACNGKRWIAGKPQLQSADRATRKG